MPEATHVNEETPEGASADDQERIGVKSIPVAGEGEVVLAARYYKIDFSGCMACDEPNPDVLRSATTSEGQHVFAILCTSCSQIETEEMIRAGFRPGAGNQVLVNPRFLPIPAADTNAKD